MKIQIIGLLIILQLAKSQVVLSFKNQCQCSQIAVDTECNLLYPYCYWSVNQQNVGLCKTTNCYGLTSADCVLVKNCIWNGDYCLSSKTDVKCNQLEGQPGLTCQQQNLLCYGTIGLCTTIDELPNCNTYQTQEQCTMGKEGKCQWTTQNACSFYQNCQQIPLNMCNNYKPYESIYSQGQYCHINNNGLCVQMTCSDITTESNCKFVQTVFNQDQYYLCSWNAFSKTCGNASNTSNLTEETCFSNTIGTYHWIAENKQQVQGICFPCTFRIVKKQDLCLCEQLVAQMDCISAKICTWQSNKCVSSECNLFNDQQSLCAQSPGCMYLFGKGCFPFTKCSDIKGSNQFQCISQSFQCPSSNGQYCTALPIDNSIFCKQQGNAYNCGNAIIGQGQCLWNYSKNQCQYSSSCYSFGMQDCLRLKHSCYYSGYYCYPINCSYFTSASDCTYYFDYYDASYKYCYWNSQEGYCDDEKPYQLDFSSCYTSSQGQYRWSSLDQKVGVCTQCAAVIIPNKRKWCSCDQLIYQKDCATAYDSCLWNPEKSQCVVLDCSMLKSRNLCVQNYNCHWIQYQDVMQCLPFTSCDKLPGSNSYTCLLYSQRCTQTDGQFCKELSYADNKQKCSSIADYTNCYLTVAADGVCRQNSQTQKCYALSECYEINEMALCGINQLCCT
ncbi:unnamed protein product, partial (macronuclear) [Paramecium tetraurelia]